MILRELPRTHLDRLAPALLADHTLILLVPATADGDWAVAAAWDVARAASAGRRVAFIDLHLEHPALDARADHTGAEGIVDAFEFGVSLTHVAHPQAPATLHYIPVGTAPSSPTAVWGNPRWERLRRGFEREGALLLGYAPAHALPELAAAPDGVLVLAPRGYDPDTQPLPALDRAGVALLGVVQDEPAGPPDPGAPPPYLGRPRSPVDRAGTVHPERENRRRVASRWRLAAIGGAVVLAVVLTFSLRGPSTAEPPSAEGRAPGRAESPSAAGRTPGTTMADSLFYSVQVAAFSDLDQAMEHAAQLDRQGQPAFVTPVLVGRNATVWHRVLVGALRTPEAAEALLADLWSGGEARRGQGVVLRTPQALELSSHTDEEAAWNAVRGLRAAGVPAYIVPGADGGAVVLVGAFEAPEQARLADSLLAAAGASGTLVTRRGLSITR